MVVRLMWFKEQKETELLKLTERDIYQNHMNFIQIKLITKIQYKNMIILKSAKIIRLKG